MPLVGSKCALYLHHVVGIIDLKFFRGSINKHQNRGNYSIVISSQGEVVNGAERVFFSPQVLRRAWNGQIKKKQRFIKQKPMRNPRVTISKLYLAPFWQKTTIYANHPKN